MKPEILLKAYVQYQSEDAFRNLVEGTLDATYSASLRIIPGAPHLAEGIVMGAYSELARTASRLGNDVILDAWLREHMCKAAVKILRAEDRTIDWAALKKEKDALLSPTDVRPAPPGMAVYICRTIFMSGALDKGRGLFLPQVWRPNWTRPVQIGGVALCALAMILYWRMPVHSPNPIILSEGSSLTPAAYAQLASPVVNHTAGTNTNQP